MVARMAPPSARTAVIVAPAIGIFCAFVILPTMAPAAAFSTGASEAADVAPSANAEPAPSIDEAVSARPRNKLWCVLIIRRSSQARRLVVARARHDEDGFVKKTALSR